MSEEYAFVSVKPEPLDEDDVEEEAFDLRKVKTENIYEEYSAEHHETLHPDPGPSIKTEPLDDTGYIDSESCQYTSADQQPDRETKAPSNTEDINTQIKRTILPNSSRIPEENGTEIPKAVFKCDTCFKLFYHRRHLRQHTINVHPSEDAIRNCDICKKEFKTIHYLKAHLKLVHPTDETLFKCDQCSKLFKTKLYLLKHTQSVHPSKEVIFECHSCDKTFNAKTRLQAHLRAVHPPETETSACPVCGKIFKAKYLLQLHVTQVHSTGDDPYYCDICFKNIKTRHYYKKHMRIVHPTGDPKIKCEFCSKFFKSKQYLKVHSNRVHLWENRSCQCNLCLKMFKNEQYLKNHMNNVHELNNERKPRVRSANVKVVKKAATVRKNDSDSDPDYECPKGSKNVVPTIKEESVAVEIEITRTEVAEEMSIVIKKECEENVSPDPVMFIKCEPEFNADE